MIKAGSEMLGSQKVQIGFTAAVDTGAVLRSSKVVVRFTAVHSATHVSLILSTLWCFVNSFVLFFNQGGAKDGLVYIQFFFYIYFSIQLLYFLLKNNSNYTNLGTKMSGTESS